MKSLICPVRICIMRNRVRNQIAVFRDVEEWLKFSNYPQLVITDGA